jgi:hypothetical protein
MKSLESERNNFIKSLWKDHKEYASVKYPKPVKLEEASIGPDEYVVIYDLLGDGLGTKVLKGKKIVDAFFTELNTDQVEANVAKFRKSFETADLKGFDSELASSLYMQLMASPLGGIPKDVPITIIADGVLALLPFEILVSGGTAEGKQGRFGEQPYGILVIGNHLVLHKLTKIRDGVAFGTAVRHRFQSFD